MVDWKTGFYSASGGELTFSADHGQTWQAVGPTLPSKLCGSPVLSERKLIAECTFGESPKSRLFAVDTSTLTAPSK